MSVPRLHGWLFRSARELRRAVEAPVMGARVSRERPVELLLISTCQRHELFLLSDDRLSPPSSAIRAFESSDAALRLFEITSGVLSDVPGEEAVAGQVRKAIRQALRSGLAGSAMTKLVRAALRAGESLRSRVRETTPIIDLPELVADLVDGRVVLLGAGALGRSINEALVARGISPALWATRTPRSEAHMTIPTALRSLRNGDTLISALAGDHRPIDIETPNVQIIDLAEPSNVRHVPDRSLRGRTLVLRDVIDASSERLAAQANAVARAAHRLPALAESALAECICPSVKALNRAIGAFRKNIIDAEMKRLAPVLAEMDESKANIIERSITHAAARTAHPLHEYVNALGRQGRADDARLLIDHILGSRIGIQTGGTGAKRPRKREGTS